MFFFGLVIIHGDNWWILSRCKSSHFLHHFGHRDMLTDISANIFFKIDPRRGLLADSIRFKLGKRQNIRFSSFSDQGQRTPGFQIQDRWETLRQWWSTLCLKRTAGRGGSSLVVIRECEESELGGLKIRMAIAGVTLSLNLLLVIRSTASTISATRAGRSTGSHTRNLTAFPACVADIDCEAISIERSEHFKCFQFMCFPWNNEKLQSPYKSCQKKSDCNSSEMDCLRHQDRRNVLRGICLHESDLLSCFSHTDCPDGQQCLVGWCTGQPEYLEAIAEMGCDSDNFCEDLLLGDACCYDLRGAVLPEGSWHGEGDDFQSLFYCH